MKDGLFEARFGLIYCDPASVQNRAEHPFGTAK
jgi:hypothetical protein